MEVDNRPDGPQGFRLNDNGGCDHVVRAGKPLFSKLLLWMKLGRHYYSWMSLNWQ